LVYLLFFFLSLFISGFFLHFERLKRSVSRFWQADMSDLFPFLHLIYLFIRIYLLIVLVLFSGIYPSTLALQAPVS